MMSLLRAVYINSTLAFEQRPENSLLLKPSYAPANIPSPILLILVTATLTVVTQGASVTVEVLESKKTLNLSSRRTL